jgi:hypothetical protein
MKSGIESTTKSREKEVLLRILMKNQLSKDKR